MAAAAFKSATGAPGRLARGVAAHARQRARMRARGRRAPRACGDERWKQEVFSQRPRDRLAPRIARGAHPRRPPRGRPDLACATVADPGLAFFSPGLLTAEKTVIRFRPADATCRRE
jgi:hypothetical protein